MANRTLNRNRGRFIFPKAKLERIAELRDGFAAFYNAPHLDPVTKADLCLRLACVQEAITRHRDALANVGLLRAMGSLRSAYQGELAVLEADQAAVLRQLGVKHMNGTGRPARFKDLDPMQQQAEADRLLREMNGEPAV